MKKLLVLIIIAVLSISLILVLKYKNFDKASETGHSLLYEHEGGIEQYSNDDNKDGFSINGILPSFSKPSAEQTEKKNYSLLIKELKNYLKDKPGTYGLHFISLNNRIRFGINDNQGFVAASTTKVPINLYLFNRIVQKKVNPDTMLVYEEEDYEEGTGSIQYKKTGTKYSIRELSRLSIVQSDNVANNMLVKHLGWGNIKKFMESIVKHEVDYEHNTFTPRDMATFMKAVLDFSKKYKNEGNELLEYLENTEFNDRMPLYLPEGTIVAHKIGTQVRAINDIGIVFAENPFILSVMSKDINDDNQACEVIASLTKIIYDFEQK